MPADMKNTRNAVKQSEENAKAARDPIHRCVVTMMRENRIPPVNGALLLIGESIKHARELNADAVTDYVSGFLEVLTSDIDTSDPESLGDSDSFKKMVDGALALQKSYEDLESENTGARKDMIKAIPAGTPIH